MSPEYGPRSAETLSEQDWQFIETEFPKLKSERGTYTLITPVATTVYYSSEVISGPVRNSLYYILRVDQHRDILLAYTLDPTSRQISASIDTRTARGDDRVELLSMLAEQGGGYRPRGGQLDEFTFTGLRESLDELREDRRHYR